MSTTTQDIRQSIKTKLEAMQTLKTVKDHKTSDIDGDYPVAMLSLGEGDGEVRANVKALTRYSFNVDVYTEMGTNFTPEKAERVTNEIVDEMLAAFRADTTLSGTVTYVEQIEWDAAFEQREHDVRVVSFMINAQAVETIS